MGVMRIAAGLIAAFMCLAHPANARIDPHDLSDDSSEMELLRSLHGLAMRNEGVLSLRITSGATVEISDAHDCRGVDADQDVMRCVTHRLIAHVAEHHAFVIRNDHWVTYDYSWMDDRTGAMVRIEDLPHLSPDGGHFIVTKPNQMPGFNGIQLWRLEDDMPVLEFQYSPPAFALYDFRDWVDGEHVELDETTYVDRVPVVRPARLVHSRSGWHVEAAAF